MFRYLSRSFVIVGYWKSRAGYKLCIMKKKILYHKMQYSSTMIYECLDKHSYCLLLQKQQTTNIHSILVGRMFWIQMSLLELFQDNELSSLSNGSGSSLSQLSELHVLDIHNNCIEKLPEDIDALKTLKVKVYLWTILTIFYSKKTLLLWNHIYLIWKLFSALYLVLN